MSWLFQTWKSVWCFSDPEAELGTAQSQLVLFRTTHIFWADKGGIFKSCFSVLKHMTSERLTLSEFISVFQVTNLVLIVLGPDSICMCYTNSSEWLDRRIIIFLQHEFTRTTELNIHEMYTCTLVLFYSC